MRFTAWFTVMKNAKEEETFVSLRPEWSASHQLGHPARNSEHHHTSASFLSNRNPALRCFPRCERGFTRTRGDDDKVGTTTTSYVTALVNDLREPCFTPATESIKPASLAGVIEFLFCLITLATPWNDPPKIRRISLSLSFSLFKRVIDSG